MINFTFKGHKIAIRNDDWRKLKERFNPDNAERDGDGDYVIRIPCPLCDRHENCQGCPIDKVDEYSCGLIINHIFRETHFHTDNYNKVWWYSEDNIQARRQLKAILRRMERIEASQ